jgi:hypothetical protein
MDMGEEKIKQLQGESLSVFFPRNYGVKSSHQEINAVIIQFLDSGLPVVSIECKDNELLPGLELKAKRVYEMLRHDYVRDLIDSI